MNKKTIGVFSVLYLIAGVLIGWKLFTKAEFKDADITEVNKIFKEVERNCEGLEHKPEMLEQKQMKSSQRQMVFETLDSLDTNYDFVVIDKNKNLCYQRGHYEDRTIEEAIRHHNAYQKQNDYLVLVKTVNNQYIISDQRELGFRIAILYVGVGIFLVIFCIRWNMMYIQPFQKMKEFARQVSNGNLDYPLDMDHKNLFGAFTESFDIMREELKNAQEQEYEANVSKKELVAALSHDIKSPVTSIKIISEVLLEKVKQEDCIEKIQNIYESADRIDSLVSNLFESTLQDLGELKVEVSDEYAECLLKMIEHADYQKRGVIFNQPDWMVQIDTVRMEQVITNIFANSYKYANTKIQVSFERDNEFLRMDIKDFGPGVSTDEKPLIFQKFYRGNSLAVKKQKGAGLGLYICRCCMEKMGGSISCRMESDGFVIEVYILLSE